MPQRTWRALAALAASTVLLGACAAFERDEAGRRSGSTPSDASGRDAPEGRSCGERCHVTLTSLCTDDTEVSDHFTATGWIRATTNLPDGVDVTITATSDEASDGVAIGEGTAQHLGVAIEVGLSAPGEALQVTSARVADGDGAPEPVDVRGTTRFTADLEDRCVETAQAGGPAQASTG